MFGLPKINSLKPILKVGEETGNSIDVFQPVSEGRPREQVNLMEYMIN